MSKLSGRTLGWASACFLFVLAPLLAWASEGSVYVGTQACAECHQPEYENFSRFAKKAHSAKSVQIMASDLDPEELKECFACHTTGYGKPGGFTGFAETPHLADAGCEVCHGPGSRHVEEGGDRSLIKHDLNLKDCEVCHNAERVGAFNFKPLLFGGAH